MQGYKTLIFSLLVSIVGVLSATDWVQLLGSTKAGIVVTGIGVASAILRFMTTTPVATSSSSS